MTASPLDNAHYLGTSGKRRPARIRIVHLGLGNFHRAHQAWYTAHAIDAAQWGIAAFTGRSAAQAEQLEKQDGLYCLVTRDALDDRVEIIGSILETIDGSRVDLLERYVSSPDVSIVTMTVTEAGYRLDSAGLVDRVDATVRDDLVLLRGGAANGSLAGLAPASILARLVVALDARRRASGLPIAVVPCDNVPNNGDYVARGVREWAEATLPELAAWITTNVSFVNTSVDRITPRAVGAISAVADAGWSDRSSVVTEPFSDWVLAGEFPAGRPLWESAGARFVTDIEPWERRKLWLLNGAHSVLAFIGLLRGHATVSEAVVDAFCLEAVHAFWDEAVLALPDGIEHERYRDDLVARFTNPRIEHSLRQIADDSATKVRYRIVPVATRTVQSGRDAFGSARAIASWIDAIASGQLPDESTTDRTSVVHDPARSLVASVSPLLARDDSFMTAVRRARTADVLLPSRSPMKGLPR